MDEGCHEWFDDGDFGFAWGWVDDVVEVWTWEHAFEGLDKIGGA